MAGTFRERTDELRQKTGMPGRLEARLTVDQRYAHAQHEHLEWRHPRGGQAKYLEGPLFDRYHHYLDDYARTVLKDGGKPAMLRAADDLSDQVELHAPKLWEHLRFSGHPQVFASGHVIYDRPPKIARLTDEQLRRLSRRLWPTLPDRLKGWIYWHNTARGRAGLPPPRRGRP